MLHNTKKKCRKILLILINVINKKRGVADQFKKETIKKRGGDPTDASEPLDGWLEPNPTE